MSLFAISTSADDLRMFVKESNAIEGIFDEPPQGDLDAHQDLVRSRLLVEDVEHFVKRVAGAPLRDQPGMDVIVGAHRPPAGGPLIRAGLELVVGDARRQADPFSTHRAYESLHPFMDGNGRSGRAIWLWQMLRRPNPEVALQRAFLHSWYYQSLAAGDRA